MARSRSPISIPPRSSRKPHIRPRTARRHDDAAGARGAPDSSDLESLRAPANDRALLRRRAHLPPRPGRTYANCEVGPLPRWLPTCLPQLPPFRSLLRPFAHVRLRFRAVPVSRPDCRQPQAHGHPGRAPARQDRLTEVATLNRLPVWGKKRDEAASAASLSSRAGDRLLSCLRTSCDTGATLAQATSPEPGSGFEPGTRVSTVVALLRKLENLVRAHGCNRERSIHKKLLLSFHSRSKVDFHASAAGLIGLLRRTDLIRVRAEDAAIAR
jgi:hypothetical protein